VSLSKDEKQVILDTLALLAAERVRLSQRSSDSVVLTIRLTELDRELKHIYERLGKLLDEKTDKEPSP
jgi:hypothetical protein